MITVKTASQISVMKEACKISAEALALAGRSVEDGMSTKELDAIMHKFIVKAGAKPSFLGYAGFPATACISINDEVIHGIPNKHRIIRSGDIVSVDVGAYYRGYHGDNAATFAVGEVSSDARQILAVTSEALMKGIAQAVVGNRVGDISHAIEEYVRTFGYGIVKKYVGHGVGAEMHEEPEIPNFGPAGRGVRLVEGMTIAIEPMINIKGDDVKVMPDQWTVKTVSGSLSAHFEHTVAITQNGPIIMTAV